MRKPIKRKKKTNEVGQAQMAGPSGPQYDTTGNQRLESVYINVGDWADIITEHVSKLIEKNLVEAEVKTKVTVSNIKDQHLPVAKNSELDAIKALAGIGKTSEINNGSNVTLTAHEKSKLMKQHNINPGTPEWFKLWFSRPYMTGEKPIGN